MKIQKYRGKNEQDVIEKIKDELGPSAIILNVKTLKSNWFLRLFAKEKVEIIAATDAGTPQAIPNLSPDIVPEAKKPDVIFDELKEKMNSMEQLLESTANKMENFYKESQLKESYLKELGLQKPALEESIVEAETNKSKMEKLIYEHLVKQEVEEEVARALLRGTDDLGEDPEIQDVIRIVYNNIANMIGQVDIIDENSGETQGAQAIFFIGPTGVGKTTSIAKLTADFSLKKEKKVALITADTYRIAAIDQLRTYSEILSVPLKVVYCADELKEGIEGFAQKDYIFVDTAGRSHKNDEHLDELGDMLNMFTRKKVYLVLSATTKFTDLISIVKRYSKLCTDYGIIITKTDETASAGTILNLKYYTEKALSYVSFGQNVPDDIEIIDGGKYAKILLGSLGDE